MKSAILPILTSIWLFVVFVPSGLKLMHLEEGTFLSISLADEDSESPEYEDFDEEVLLQECNNYHSKIKALTSFFIVPAMDSLIRLHLVEIFLPPPE